jgi:hypothetical protein
LPSRASLLTVVVLSVDPLSVDLEFDVTSRWRWSICALVDEYWIAQYACARTGL